MRRPALGHLIGYTALTIMLTAGAAQGLAGSNTVFTDDIANGNVGYADIKDGAVGGRKVLNNSLTGADINESTLSWPTGQLTKVGIPPGKYLFVGHGTVEALETIGVQNVLCSAVVTGTGVTSTTHGSRVDLPEARARHVVMMEGTFTVPAGSTGELSLRCNSTGLTGVDDVNAVIVRLGGIGL